MLPRELFAAWTTAQQIGLSKPANWGTAARAAPPNNPGWSPRELGFVCLLRSVPGGGRRSGGMDGHGRRAFLLAAHHGEKLGLSKKKQNQLVNLKLGIFSWIGGGS